MDNKDKLKTSLARSTIEEIIQTWEKLTSMTRYAVTGKVAPDLPGADADQVRKQIADCIYARGGEVSSRARSVELGKLFLGLSPVGRAKFMKILAHDFDIDSKKAIEAVNDLLASNATDEQAQIKAEMKLARALSSPRIKLLKQFNTLPNGFKFLVDFRAQLLAIKKEHRDDPYLDKLDTDLKEILASWFDIGLLDLRKITWHSPASLLEKLIAYEAVHAIRSWSDLKNRLDSDRECFAFFHNKMPDEPLIFVEIALVNEMSSNIQALLDENAPKNDPGKADTAIFYSISSTQRGLYGISHGNFLIKRVVEELSDQLKSLKHFATLSPIPRFRPWLNAHLEEMEESVFNPKEISFLQKKTGNESAVQALKEILDTPWYEDEKTVKNFKPMLMRFAVQYLTSRKANGKALDPVANFHLTNGARIERLNWLGDTSEKGMRESAGMMVNYYYKIPEIEKNHENYISNLQINISKDVRRWL